MSQETDHDQKLEESEMVDIPEGDSSGENDQPVEESTSENEVKEETTSEKQVEEEEMVTITVKEYDELKSAKLVANEEIKRARADGLNFRKRVEKEKAEFLEYSTGKVLSKLLPISDDLRRLIENAEGEVAETHFNAIKAIDQRLNSIYEAEGVELIRIKKGKTAFDPKYHDAVFALETDEYPPNIVIDVTGTGFVKGERVLRPAKVVISKGKKVEEQPSEEEVAEVEKEEN